MSICIDCKKGAHECEWLFRLKPVKGWSAKKVKSNGFVTYEVSGCPSFEKNRPNVRYRRSRAEIEEDRKIALEYVRENEVRKCGA